MTHTADWLTGPARPGIRTGDAAEAELPEVNASGV